MLLTLLLLFTVLPLLEFAVLFQMGQHLGLWPTIALVLATGAIGAALARWQGFRTLWRIRTEMAAGRAPTDSLIDGALIVFAGAVLITPGVITDAMGFALLIPPSRAVVRIALKKWFAHQIKDGAVTSGATSGGFRFVRFGTPGARPTPQPPQGRVIDVEVTDVRTRDA